MAGSRTSDAIAVFAKRHIAHPVEAIFDVPMIPPPSEQLRCTGLSRSGAGDRVGRFDRLFALSFDSASQTTDPLMAGPVERVSQS